jgi:triosephosphate isomerase
MMRRPIITANWKMHKMVGEAIDFVTSLQKELEGWKAAEVVLAPSFVALSPIGERLKGGDLALAAQDIFWEDKGAYTGEISPLMLRDVGCRYAIIGHSERRTYFGETDETVNKKVKAALSNDLNPIICVGESLKERESGDTIKVVQRQVTDALKEVGIEAARRIVIAYEPIWAIGTGKTASTGQAQEVQSYIRRFLGDIFSPDLAEVIRIQYGGSVKPDNIDELMAQPDIDGALVGGASLDLGSFVRIVRFEGV